MKKTLRKLLFITVVITVLTAVMCFSSSAYSQGDFEYEVSDGKATVTKYYNPYGNYVDVTVPSTLGGYPVTAIGDGAFSGRTTITSVTVPDSVVTIEARAFWYCQGMESIEIGKNVKTIGEAAFFYCDSLRFITVDKNNKYYSNDDSGALFNKNKTELIQYPKGRFNSTYTIPGTVKTVADNAFMECANLSCVTIPESVNVIGNSAFWGCKYLKEINIPASVTNIGMGAFTQCKWLEKITVDKSNKNYSSDSYGALFNKDKTELIHYAVGNSRESYTIPSTVVTVGREAFSGCENLTTAVIGNNVTEIGEHAFDGCIYLSNVTIGNSVVKIGSSAFHKCESIKSIAIPLSVKSIDMYAFNECRYLEAVYYQGTQQQWKKISIDYGANSSLVNAEYYFEHSHTLTTLKAVSASCKNTGLTQGKKCSVCGTVTVAQKTVSKKAHTNKTVITKATLSKNGKVTVKCSVCGYVSKSQTVYYPKTVSITYTKYVFDGKNKTPVVTIKDSKGKKLVKGTDYKLTVASKRSAIGRYTVKVTFMGNYSGTKNLYFYILPGKSDSIKSASQTSSAIKLTWSAVKGAAGYTVYRYSPSKKAYVKAGATTGTSFTVKNLLAGTKYTFRVVAYGKTSAGKVYNSNTYALIKTATCTATPTVKLASTAKGRATVAWNNVSGETGYQVYYATSKNGTYSRIANYKANTTKIYKTGLKSSKTYYFKVRAYIKTDSGYVYSPFSSVRSVRVK